MNENKLALYKKMKIDKITKELNEIQSAGEESILLIAERLEKELIDQGYEVGIHIALWHHENDRMYVQSENKAIGRRY